jgi:ABC-type transport system substrate-binding protein
VPVCFEQRQEQIIRRPQDMRQHPIGTGPFKFVSYKPNELIRLTRNL